MKDENNCIYMYQHQTLANHLKHASLSEENAGFSARLSHTCTDAHRKIRCTCSQPTAQDSIISAAEGMLHIYICVAFSAGYMQDGHVCRVCMRTMVATLEGWQPCLREIKNSRLDDE